MLADGSGPWQDARWTFAVSQFSGLLQDAGYSVKVVAPPDLASALDGPDILLAVPSLETLPIDAFLAIANHVGSGGGLMASGGEPFRDPLYLTASGQWLDSAAYQQAVGSPPPAQKFAVPTIPTISPARQQFITSTGLRVPVARVRGIYSQASSNGRYRVIGDLLAPAATLYVGSTVSVGNTLPNHVDRSYIVWLPWPQLFDPLRAQLVAALQDAPHRLYFTAAGADQPVWLPGESITGKASVVNASDAGVQATLQWSITGPSGVTSQPSTSLSFAANELREVSISIPPLPNGDYTLNFRLTIGSQEVDRIDSPVRVLSPTLTRQPDQKVHIVNGSFVAGGRHVFLRGVNYWPRYVVGLDPGAFNGQSWLEAGQYDPDLVEADLSEIAALHFNVVNIQFSDYEGFWAQEGRALIDFLERCRSHGLWVQVALRTTLTNAAYAGQISSTLENYIQAAYLPGNDRVLAYELFWEPMVGSHDSGGQGRITNGSIVYNTGRMVLDADWRAWVNDQYGSLDQAQQAWGFTAPLDPKGQLTNPLDEQIMNDGAWRVMVAAYRRFLDDYIGRNIGAIARQLRRSDPDTLLTYRNWATMTLAHNQFTGYDIGAGAAHLDYVSPERYAPVLLWPDDRPYGLIAAYGRYRSGGKPVYWAEYGSDIGANGGTSASRATQAAICDTMMRQIEDDGSSGSAVWWWPGGFGPLDGTDYGIIDPDGTPRACANALAQWNATFSATPPDVTTDPPATLMVDRDADARGSYGLLLNYQNQYLQARQSGRSVTLADQGTGTDTSTMPLVQVGNMPYSGSGPLKFANGEFGGLRVTCPSLDVTVENGSTLTVPAGAVCTVTPTLVNTGEAEWLPASAKNGGVILHTSAGDLPLATPLPSLQRATFGPVSVTVGSTTALAGRLRIPGVGDFGEVLNLTLAVDSAAGGSCAISVTPAQSLAIPSSGASGTIEIKTGMGCAWTASSFQPWMTLSSELGAGSAAISYTVLPNYGPKRETAISAGNSQFTVTEDGVSTPPLAQAPTPSAANLTFGDRTVGTSSRAQALQLTNPGPADLNILSISIGGLNNGDFSATSSCGSTLAAGRSCTVQITFTPSAAGARVASLYVAGDVEGLTSAIGLSGNGVATGPVPSIQAIVDSWGYTAGVAPGLWVTIAGTNLAGPPETWDLDGVDALPSSLGGTTVTFNGAPAALFYASPTQINALVPAGVTPGPVQVVAQVNGVTSSPFTIAASATQPAVYAPPAGDGRTFFVTAALAGTATLIGNGATDPRVARAAYPGDTLDLYMIGLGPTLDPSKFIADAVFTGAFPVSAPAAAKVGGETANVLFAGLTAPGLYLMRIVLPSGLAAGAQPLQITVGSGRTRDSLVLRVAAPPPK